MAVSKEFADYCCDLLADVGPCVAKRMFGGWGLSVDGMSIAWLIDLGQGERLWLKTNDNLRSAFKAAGCEQFRYESKGRMVTVNHFAPPEEAMESAPLMLPWARLALQAALQAQAEKAAKGVKPARITKATKQAKAGKPAKPVKKATPRKSVK